MKLRKKDGYVEEVTSGSDYQDGFNIKIETVEDLEEFFSLNPDHPIYIDKEIYREIKLWNMPIGETLQVSDVGAGVVKVKHNGKDWNKVNK